jgi:hypothetical protein
MQRPGRTYVPPQSSPTVTPPAMCPAGHIQAGVTGGSSASATSVLVSASVQPISPDIISR